MHFLNQPEDKRNFVSDLLTESLSYGMEFIYIEELKQIKYSNDLNIFMKFVASTILKYMDKVYFCYKLILLYKKDNNFIKILMEYNKVINEKSYQECLDIIGLNIDTEFVDKIKSSTDSFLESLSSQKVKKL